jgi:Na+-driven multidrug efflux pump
MSYGQAAMMMLSAGMYGVLFVFAPQVTSVFNSEGNEVLQRIAEIGLKLYFTSNIFLGFNTVAATFFTSVEKALPAHVLSLLRGFVLIIPLAFIMSVLWGMNGIWLCFPVTEAITAVLGFFIYRKILKDFQV